MECKTEERALDEKDIKINNISGTEAMMKMVCT